MRTGLKHLIGMSATLLLLLTVMLWVDGQTHETSVSLTGGRWGVWRLFAIDGRLMFHCIPSWDYDQPARFQVDRTEDAAVPWLTTIQGWYDPDRPISYAWAYEWTPGEPEYG